MSASFSLAYVYFLLFIHPWISSYLHTPGSFLLRARDRHALFPPRWRSLASRCSPLVRVASREHVSACSMPSLTRRAAPRYSSPAPSSVSLAIFISFECVLSLIYKKNKINSNISLSIVSVEPGAMGDLQVETSQPGLVSSPQRGDISQNTHR